MKKIALRINRIIYYLAIFSISIDNKFSYDV